MFLQSLNTGGEATLHTINPGGQAVNTGSEAIVHIPHLLTEADDLALQSTDGTRLPVKDAQYGDQQQDDKAQKAEEVIVRLGNQRCSPQP